MQQPVATSPAPTDPPATATPGKYPILALRTCINLLYSLRQSVACAVQLWLGATAEELAHHFGRQSSSMYTTFSDTHCRMVLLRACSRSCYSRKPAATAAFNRYSTFSRLGSGSLS
jgi:uncharacterized phage protein gp47/JayE